MRWRLVGVQGRLYRYVLVRRVVLVPTLAILLVNLRLVALKKMGVGQPLTFIFLPRRGTGHNA
jgi:hypothetical protein